MLAPALVLDVMVRAAEESPEPNDVVAGWTGFAVFVLLFLAVAFLGWSLTKQLKKVDRAEEQGLYGHDDSPTASSDDEAPASDAGADAPADKND